MLSLKQEKFCEYYVEFGNATEAAKKAGYSGKTAYSQGQRMLKNVEISNFIKELANSRKSLQTASADEVLEFFTEVMRNSNEQTKNRLKAAENLAKRFGRDKPETTQENKTESMPVFEFVFKDMTMKEDENNN